MPACSNVSASASSQESANVAWPADWVSGSRAVRFPFAVDLFSEPSSDACAVFFFQAEDGIRDYKVTGVQTCALPICRTIANVRACVSAVQKYEPNARIIIVDDGIQWENDDIRQFAIPGEHPFIFARKDRKSVV